MKLLTPARIALLPALFAAAVVPAATAAHASGGSFHIHGTISNIHTVPCPTPGPLACSESTVSGDLNGTGHGSILAVTPTSNPSVFVVTSTVTFVGAHGTFTHNDSGAANFAGAGESVSLGEIASGTGIFTGVTGYLQLRATIDPATGIGSGDYQGVLTLP